MPNRALILFLGALLVTPLPAGAQRDMAAFYPTARDRAAAPPDDAVLRVVCATQLDGVAVPAHYRGQYLSLVSAQPPTVLLAAFSKHPLARLQGAISLRVRFGPLPTALPTASGTLDWGYVYDRNRDGRVDYLVYLQNAHPVLPESLPPGFPTVERGPAGRIRVSRALAYAMIDLAEMVFRHYADDDFDGRVDAVVLEEFDAERPVFVRGWRAYRATSPGGAVDQGWTFRRDLGDTTAPLPRGPDGYRVPAAVPGDPPVPLDSILARASERLAAINAALGRCKIGPEALEGAE